MLRKMNKSPTAKGMSFEKEDRIWEITGYTDCAYTSPKLGMSCVAHTTDSNTINMIYRILASPSFYILFCRDKNIYLNFNSLILRPLFAIN